MPFARCLVALFLVLAGCATVPVAPPPPPPRALGYPVSAEACEALARAEADVAAATVLFALWTTARDALRDARAAATRGDSAAALRLAIRASSQARLGIEQLDYPSTDRWATGAPQNRAE